MNSKIMFVKDMFRKYGIWQFIKFCFVGVSNTLLSYLIYVAVITMLKDSQLSYDYIIANVVAFILSVLWSFCWNRRYVFNGSEENVFISLLKTYISYGFSGIVLSNLLSWVWIDIFNISKYIAPLFNLVLSVPINFLLNKYWAFKK